MNDRNPIRILLVEDHPLYRMGLRLTLNYSGLSAVIVGETENVKSAKQFLEQHGDEVNLILLDYYLPDGDGVDVINYARTYSPKAKIILLSAESRNPEIVLQTQGLVDGYWDKDEDQEAMKAKFNAMFGITDFNEEDKQYRISVKSDLSPREIEIIQLCANGLSAQQIADRLSLSRRTVEVHKSHIFEKLDLKTTVDLVKYAYDAGLVK